MADTKVSALTLITSLSAADLLYVVDDPGGTPLSRAITVENTIKFNDDRTKVLTNTTLDANGTGNALSNIETADLAAAAKTGLDAKVVTGTEGTVNDLAIWNADGDLVDGPTPPSGAIIGTTDTQPLTNKTIDGDNNTVSNLAIGAEVDTALVETQDLWIGAEAMVPNTTNGAEFASRELPTNDVMISAMKFYTKTAELAQFTCTPPGKWNAGTVKFTAYWTNGAGLTTETIDFDLAAVALANDDPLDTAFGTAANITDTWIAQDDLHISAQSAAITIAGSPAAGEMVIFRLSRDVAADNMTGDVEIIGIQLEYTINDIGTT